MTTRRAFLATLAAGFLGPSRVAEAQQQEGKVWRIGYLGYGYPTESSDLAVFASSCDTHRSNSTRIRT